MLKAILKTLKDIKVSDAEYLDNDYSKVVEIVSVSERAIPGAYGSIQGYETTFTALMDNGSKEKIVEEMALSEILKID